MMKRFLIAFFIFFTAIVTHGQNAGIKITLRLEDQPLDVILDSISATSNLFFAYNAAIVSPDKRFSCNAENQQLPSFLDDLLSGTGIIYTFSNDQIVLRKLDGRTRPPGGPSNFTLYGWASDEETGEFVPGVNVYLDGTSIGTVTNVNGYYKFENVPYGFYNLVFSHVSYEKFTFQFAVREEGAAVVNGKMKLSLNQLAGVEVRSNRWNEIVEEEELVKAYGVFQDEFLGKTFNSRKCQILNREALSFFTDDNKDTLFAEASSPLRIRNEALGYMIIYELEYFRNYLDGISYAGNVRFEQLPVIDPRDIKRWRKNRRKTYSGSLRHFLKSLVSDDLRKQGYRIYATENLIFISNDTSSPLERQDVLRSKEGSRWDLEFDGYIYVEYVKEKESDLFMTHMTREIQQKAFLTGNNIFFLSRKAGEQRSLLKLKGSSVEIDANGHIQEPLSVSTVGYWAWERFADLLPIDYDPKVDKIK